MQIAAIGPATKAAIERHGLKVHVVPRQYVAESVVQSLRRKVTGKRVLLARAKVARDVIPRELRKLGARVDVVEAYETVIPRVIAQTPAGCAEVPEPQAGLHYLYQFLHRPEFCGIVGKAVENAGKEGASGSRVLASIGPVTSATLRELKLPVDVEARQYTIPGLVQAMVRSIRRN